ncbi:MAG: hypothetical protein AABW92_01585 [Nanoarchaeota archaeon]
MDDPDILEEVEEDKKSISIIKRTYIIVIALLMVTLLLVNSQTGYHLVSFLSGKIVSSNINLDSSFDLKKGGQVVFENETYADLKQVYLDNQKHEFKACLTGYKDDKNYVITGLYIPIIYQQDVYSVTSQLCNSSTIISMHSHPPLRCIFSEQDIKSYESFKQIKPEGIIGLMCGEERMTFYGYSAG